MQNELSFFQLVLDASPLVQFVMASLVLASILSPTYQDSNYSPAPAGLSNPAVQRIEPSGFDRFWPAKCRFSLPRGLDLAIQAEQGE